MIWRIAQKEFLLNLMTFKFAVGTTVCIVLTAVFMPILAADYRQRLETYRKHITENEAELRTAVVYKNIRHTIYRPPAVLSAFSAGLDRQLTGSAQMELAKVPALTVTERKGNPYLPILAVFDESLIFKIVMSILALLVAYDVVAGEREQGTLKLMLTGQTARHHVLLGKFLAGMATLTVPVFITFTIALTVLLSSASVHFSAADWTRIGLMFVASMAFTTVMYLLGLLFSCLVKASAVSMVLGLFAWIVFAIVIPNASVHLATQLRPLEPLESREGRMTSLREDLDREVDKIEGEMDYSNAVITSDASDAFGGYYAKRRDIYWLRLDQEKNRRTLPIQVRYADKLFDVQQSNLNSFVAQKDLARCLSFISPISTYENAMAILAGTDMMNFVHFINQARAHRNDVVDYIRTKTDDFSSASFFAICSEEDSAEYTRLYVQVRDAVNDEAKAKAQQALHDWEQDHPAAPEPLDLRDFPWFHYRPSALGDFRRAMPDLAALFVTSIVLFALCFAVFAKYDIR